MFSKHLSRKLPTHLQSFLLGGNASLLRLSRVARNGGNIPAKLKNTWAKLNVPAQSYKASVSSVELLSCVQLCYRMDCSTPGFPVDHQLPEPTQTHVHRLGDAIQPFHPVFPFSSCLQYFLTSGSFPMSQFFPSGGQIIGASTSACFSSEYSGLMFLGCTGLIPLQSKGISRVFSNTIVQRAYMCVTCQ